MIKIAPSILAADFANMARDIERITKAGADYIHCDVMDGSFVPSITFGGQMLGAIKKHTDLPLDVHLMIVEPHKHIEEFAKAGANIITFHPETCFHPHKTLGDIKKCGAKAGIVLNPGTAVSSIEPLLPLCDLVLLMSVNPGWGGQAFIPEVLKKSIALREMKKQNNWSFEIEIDGGINDKTAKLARESGVEVLVAGSYVFAAENLKERMDSLRA